MSKPLLLTFIVALIAVLSAAAVEILPGTYHYPIVEYSVAGVDVTVLKAGELTRDECERSLRPVTEAVRANCPRCPLVSQCVKGIESGHLKALSREPLAVPSLRTGAVTMTFEAAMPDLAAAVCRAAEAQAATTGTKIRCYPALAQR